MRAAVVEAYGPPEAVQIVERPDPVASAGEVLVEVHASTVNVGDTEIRASNMPWLFRLPLRLWLWLFRPRDLVLGMEVAGVVVAVGDGVSDFAVGDRVCGQMGMAFGGHAELARVPVDGLIARIPAGVSFEQAAPLTISGLSGQNYLRLGGLAAGQRVLIRGATGAIGSYAVQVARAAGAHVTALVGPAGVERAVELGAHEVLDYTQCGLEELDEPFDLMLDVVGQRSIRSCLRVVKPGGAYVRATVPGLWEGLRALISRLGRKRVLMGDAGGTSEELAELLRQVAEGRLVSLVDRTFPLEAIAEAHTYAGSGHKQGQAVVIVR